MDTEEQLQRVTALYESSLRKWTDPPRLNDMDDMTMNSVVGGLAQLFDLRSRLEQRLLIDRHRQLASKASNGRTAS